ncbi:TAP42-like protein [Lipomyces japonicus]|uniref:TAP42-like protein n=1 Tax=Lipomyces japonicus TaxID=56871 RepID=UPI0034CFFFCC
MTDQNRTLKEEFASALSSYTKLIPDYATIQIPSSTSSSNDALSTEKYTSLLLETILLFESAKQKSERLSLFSLNETVDDIGTNNIQYLAIDYYLAILNDKISTQTTFERKPLALKTKKLYLTFLTLCDSYGLLEKQPSNLLREILEAPIDTPSFSIAFERGFSDSGAQRQAKIAKYNREKELEKAIKDLRSRPDRIKNDEDGDDVGRQLYLQQIALFVERSFNVLQSLDVELEVLAFAATRPIETDVKQLPREMEKGDYSERLDLPKPGLDPRAPILSSAGKINRPFTIVSSRDQIRKNVFKPDYILPTMTIDEYLKEERMRGGIIEGGGPDSAKKSESDEDNEEENDKETYKQRKWDEFKEANPKGSGNTMNRG